MIGAVVITPEKSDGAVSVGLGPPAALEDPARFLEGAAQYERGLAAWSTASRRQAATAFAEATVASRRAMGWGCLPQSVASLVWVLFDAVERNRPLDAGPWEVALESVARSEGQAPRSVVAHAHLGLAIVALSGGALGACSRHLEDLRRCRGGATADLIETHIEYVVQDLLVTTSA